MNEPETLYMNKDHCARKSDGQKEESVKQYVRRGHKNYRKIEQERKKYNFEYNQRITQTNTGKLVIREQQILTLEDIKEELKVQKTL